MARWGAIRRRAREALRRVASSWVSQESDPCVPPVLSPTDVPGLRLVHSSFTTFGPLEPEQVDEYWVSRQPVDAEGKLYQRVYLTVHLCRSRREAFTVAQGVHGAFPGDPPKFEFMIPAQKMVGTPTGRIIGDICWTPIGFTDPRAAWSSPSLLFMQGRYLVSVRLVDVPARDADEQVEALAERVSAILKGPRVW